MAKQEHKGRSLEDRDKIEKALQESGEVGGFAAEGGPTPGHGAPHHPHAGRTIGDTATSYSSVGGAEEPEEWPEGWPDDLSPSGEMPAGAQTPESGTGAVHNVRFRPAPGGYAETSGRAGRNIPFTGEVISTRDAPFEEDPDTGRTAVEEEGEFLTESLEERTRGYESG